MSRAPYASLNLATHVGDDPVHVSVNRSLLAAAIGGAGDRVAVIGAVHGGEVAVVAEPGTVAGVDALVTQQPGLVMLALGADCVPIALIGSDGLTIGVAHCGWRGLVADVLGAAVAAMRGLGAEIAEVVLGPSACGECYPVPEERASRVASATGSGVRAAALVMTADGQPGIDVREGLRARLVELGVPAERAVVAGGCTVEDPGLFSFRRDGVTGRQGVAVCMREMMNT